jgi:hypothetical protein
MSAQAPHRSEEAKLKGVLEGIALMKLNAKGMH